MYYPLLRARQFELIALRELATEGSTQGYIKPILEPVKIKNNNLNLAYQVLLERSQEAYLIVNPSVGEGRGDTNYYLDFLIDLNPEIFKPTFRYNNNAGYIRNSIDNYSLQNCMIICENDINPDNLDFQDLMELSEVTSIVLNDPGRNRALDRYLKGLHKTYIRLDDLFAKQNRNSDFLTIEAHRFSEEHLYYSDDNYDGFSDYTILPSEFLDGGSTPRAVAIHCTYLNGKNQIWIRHFTSITNDSISNVQGKFAQAAEKMVNYCDQNNLSNSAINELDDYFQEEHYPGLGTVKKISIKNHLLVVRNFLSSQTET